MKKLLIICLMLVCALVLTACGQAKQEQSLRRLFSTRAWAILR